MANLRCGVVKKKYIIKLRNKDTGRLLSEFSIKAESLECAKLRALQEKGFDKYDIECTEAD